MRCTACNTAPPRTHAAGGTGKPARRTPQHAVHRLQYGSRLKGEDGDKVTRGQRIAEWDPYTRPILTEVEGTIGFEDLVDGVSMSEQLDDSTGIAKRVVIDWRTGSS